MLLDAQSVSVVCVRFCDCLRCALLCPCSESLGDNNYKVSQTALNILAHLVKTEADTIKPYANAIVPLVVCGCAREQQQQYFK